MSFNPFEQKPENLDKFAIGKPCIRKVIPKTT